MKVNSNLLTACEPPRHVEENLRQQLKDGKLSVKDPDIWYSKQSATLEISGEGRKMLSREEKAGLLQSMIKPNTPNRIFPNLKTNDMLKDGLDGADDDTKKAAWSIIDNNLMPHNVGNMTEDERREMIALGLEEAKFLSQSLDPEKRESFMNAMNTIAKYGINGKQDENGTMSYDVRWGNPTGVPDDFLPGSDAMKVVDPKSYKEYTDILSGVKGDDEQSRALLRKAHEMYLGWEAVNHYEIQAAGRELKSWADNVENTRVETPYANTDHTSRQKFIDSILNQSKHLNHDFLKEHLQNFFES